MNCAESGEPNFDQFGRKTFFKKILGYYPSRKSKFRSDTFFRFFLSFLKIYSLPCLLATKRYITGLAFLRGVIGSISIWAPRKVKILDRIEVKIPKLPINGPNTKCSVQWQVAKQPGCHPICSKEAGYNAGNYGACDDHCGGFCCRPDGDTNYCTDELLKQAESEFPTNDRHYCVFPGNWTRPYFSNSTFLLAVVLPLDRIYVMNLGRFFSTWGPPHDFFFKFLFFF